jgi:hypothetical protein
MQFTVLLGLVLLPAVAALAQVQGGNISGTVKDDQGAVVPGVTVTLAGSDRTLTFVTETDGKYRFLNQPPGSYTVSAALAGFKTFVWENIVLIVGGNVEIPVTLSVAAVAESVTVVGESPIINTKALGTATNFTQDELARIPNSRDPWALLRTVPGVLVDRVNIAGNETGQQSNFVSKGTRRQDAVWNMDGVVITDMAAVGASPTYFDYDAFDEIQISTAGNDVRQPTGGVGLNFVVKRGTNRFSGTARGYYTTEGLEWSNVHPELGARGVTPDNADHNVQIADYGGDVGGPIYKDKAWFWASWTKQDIRLFRNATNALDQTILKTNNVKGNWQITDKDMFSVLWFLGSKEKFGRQTGRAQVEPASATWNQGNFFPDSRPHGLLKFENNHIFTPSFFVTSKYAYYGTGFTLSPIGGLDQQAGISSRLGQTFGSTNASNFIRPQTTVTADADYFKDAWGASHTFKFGGGYRRAEGTAQTLWPGDLVVALDNSATDQRARLYREGFGGNRGEYFHLYVGDTISRDRLTLNLAVRYDRQWGNAIASQTQSNGAFPNLVPGIDFGGYRTPFTWNNLSPRVGVTYALDETHTTLLRASFTRYASQLDTGLVGFSNPSANAGWAEYPWVDLNGDHLAQPNEVRTDQPVISFGGGFNPAARTAVSSADVLDPDLTAPVQTGIVVGIDRELRPDLAVQVTYTYGRGDDEHYAPWLGLTTADYLPGASVTGNLPDGTSYSIPTFLPDAARVAAGGNGRIWSNFDGYHTSFNGVEANLIKRMSNRWMMRLSAAYNDAREYYDQNPPVGGGRSDSAVLISGSSGNPTRTDSSPLVDGGQVAPRSSGSGGGDIFVNGKWQFNLNGVYQLPYDVEVAGNLFGRDGTVFPFFRQTALGRDGSHRVLVTSELDSFRLPTLWNLDLRLAKHFRWDQVNLQLVADLFNVFNSNTGLQRERNIASANFNRLNQTLSPRIVRFGVRFGF